MLDRDAVTRHPALVDPETGLANRLHFELLYGYLFLAGDRGMAFTVVSLSAGTEDEDGADRERRRAVARTLDETTRAADLVAHLGAGRFALILLGTNLSGARIAGDRVEAALASVAPGPVSVGLAAFHPEMSDPAELLAAADRALETARAAGGGVEMA